MLRFLLPDRCLRIADLHKRNGRANSKGILYAFANGEISEEELDAGLEELERQAAKRNSPRLKA